MFMSTKQLRNKIFKILQEKDYPDYVPELMSYPLKKIIFILFSGLNNKDERIKWHSVAGFGDVIKVLVEKDPNQGRIFIRRLLWMLSDESVGIAWGIPEVMGEILSKVDILAREYSSILVSQIIDLKGRPDNFLEYEPLRRGGYWAVARFSLSYPELVKKYVPEIVDTLVFENDLFIWVMGLYILKILRVSWLGAKKFCESQERIRIFWNYKFQDVNIGELAQEVCKIR